MTEIRFFSVRNFEKFQHYKDRNPPWIRLYNSLLDDYRFARLPDASKAHLLAIYLLASRHDNKIPADAEWIKTSIHASEKVDLDLLAKLEFIILDQSCTETLASGKQSDAPEKRRVEERRGDSSSEESLVRAPATEFDVWWACYPEKVGKEAARKQFKSARKLASLAELIAGVERYKATKMPDRAWAHPSTWLFQGRWTDEPDPTHGVANGQSSTAGPERSSDRLAAALRLVTPGAATG